MPVAVAAPYPATTAQSGGAAPEVGEIIRVAPPVLFWAAFSFSLSYYNSWALNSSHDRFPYPFFYTMWHSVLQAIVMSVLFACFPSLQRPSVDQWRRQWPRMLALMISSTTAVGAENGALKHISVTVHESVKSAVPVVTMSVAYLLEQQIFAPRLVLCVLTLAVASGLVAAGSVVEDDDNGNRSLGLLLTIFGSFSSALRPVFISLLVRESVASEPALTETATGTGKHAVVGGSPPGQSAQRQYAEGQAAEGQAAEGQAAEGQAAEGQAAEGQAALPADQPASPFMVVWYEAIFQSFAYLLLWLTTDEREECLDALREHPGRSVGYVAPGSALALGFSIAVVELVRATSSLTSTVLGTGKHVVMVIITAFFVDKVMDKGAEHASIIGVGLVMFVSGFGLYAYLHATNQALLSGSRRSLNMRLLCHELTEVCCVRRQAAPTEGSALLGATRKS